MDLTDRENAYRTGAARCPGCGDVLRKEVITVGDALPDRDEVLIDLCDACGGLWLDWFDGNVQTLAARAEADRLDRGTRPPRSSPVEPAPRDVLPGAGGVASGAGPFGAGVACVVRSSGNLAPDAAAPSGAGILGSRPACRSTTADAADAARGGPCEHAECPRCARALFQELYRFQDARDGELLPGVEILRCAECAGSFVTRASAYLLLDRVREPRPPTLWEAVVGWLVPIVKTPPRP